MLLQLITSRILMVLLTVLYFVQCSPSISVEHPKVQTKKIYIASSTVPRKSSSSIDSSASSTSASSSDSVASANSNAYEYIEEIRPIHYSGQGYGYGDSGGPTEYGYAGDTGYGESSSAEMKGEYYPHHSSSPAHYQPHHGAPYPKAIEHRYYTIKKSSKSLFGDDVGFVVIIVGLTVFFGALSSILIPLGLSLFSNSGMIGMNGVGGGLLGGTLGAGLPMPGMMGGMLGRRRRSVDARNSTSKLEEISQRLEDALKRHEKTHPKHDRSFNE